MKKTMLITTLIFLMFFSIPIVKSAFWAPSKTLAQTKLVEVEDVGILAIQSTCPLPSWTVCERGECIDYHFYWLYVGGQKVGWASGPGFTTDSGAHEYYIRIHMDEALLHWHTVTSKTQFTGNYEIEIGNPTLIRLDFGTPTSPVNYAYIGVNDTTSYAETGILGWDDLTDLESEDRGWPDDVKGDFVKSTSDHTFIIDIPNGNWLVSMTFSDTTATQSFTHDYIDVYAEGILKIDDFNYTGGWPTRSIEVEVTDGQLNIMFHDDGGTDPYWIINAMSFTNIDPNTGIQSMSTSLTFDGSPSIVFEPSYVYGEDAIYYDCAIMWVNLTTKPDANWIEIDIPIQYKTFITDLNRDDYVDVLDAIILSNEFGESWGSLGDPIDPDDNTWRADINSDGYINIGDYVILKNQFGTEYIAPMFENNGLLNIWEADWEP